MGSNSLYHGLPAANLVIKGLSDLKQSSLTPEALLLLTAGPRLRRLGVNVPTLTVVIPFSHQLYSLLEKEHGNSAHYRYTSLLQQIASFANALESEKN